MNVGVLLGLLCGAGLGALLWAAPWRRSPGLDARVGPYLGGGTPRASRWGESLRAIGTAVAERSGAGKVVAERFTVLDPSLAGSVALHAEVAQFRAEQVLWAVAGVALAVPTGWLAAGLDPVTVFAFMVAGGIGGALLPGELLALSVGAGENVSGALERVSGGRGPLCAQLRLGLGRVRTGTPLLEALVDLAGAWGVTPFTRFVDGIAVAVEAGSPLAEVLRAQAADAREADRRRLIETGGRREVQMMVPVVFGVLPVTVVFAVFPGLAQLQLG